MSSPISFGTWFAETARHPLVIAEIAQAHDGSLGTAHALIDAAAMAGADVVKFQTHIAAAESTPAEPWRVRFSEQDASRYDYWKRMEFSPEQWDSLSRHAERAGLAFLSSPFSRQAVDLLQSIGVGAFKVASGELLSPELLAAIAATGKPVLLSTGMSSFEEIDAAVERLRAGDAPIAVLQCTSKYPCPPESIGLNLLDELAERYDCPVGLSDHSGTIYPGLAAVALGAEIVEVHLTSSRHAFGPDVPASLTVEELGMLVDGVDFVHRMLQNPLDKDSVAAELAPMRRLFTKSLVAARDLPAGHRLEAADLVAKKPGTGIPPGRLDRVVGRRLTTDLAADELLSPDHLAAEEG